MSAYFYPGVLELYEQVAAQIRHDLDARQRIRPVYLDAQGCLSGLLDTHASNERTMLEARRLYRQGGADVRRNLRVFFKDCISLALYYRRWKGPGSRLPTLAQYTLAINQLPISPALAAQGIVFDATPGNRGLEQVEAVIMARTQLCFDALPQGLRRVVERLPGIYRVNMDDSRTPFTFARFEQVSPDSRIEIFPFHRHRQNDSGLLWRCQGGMNCVRAGSRPLLWTACFYWDFLKLGKMSAEFTQQQDGRTLEDLLPRFEHIV